MSSHAAVATPSATPSATSSATSNVTASLSTAPAGIDLVTLVAAYRAQPSDQAAAALYEAFAGLIGWLIQRWAPTRGRTDGAALQADLRGAAVHALLTAVCERDVPLDAVALTQRVNTRVTAAIQGEARFTPEGPVVTVSARELRKAASRRRRAATVAHAVWGSLTAGTAAPPVAGAGLGLTRREVELLVEPRLRSARADALAAAARPALSLGGPDASDDVGELEASETTAAGGAMPDRGDGEPVSPDDAEEAQTSRAQSGRPAAPPAMLLAAGLRALTAGDARLLVQRHGLFGQPAQSVAQIAAAEGCSEMAVRKRLTRATQRLREALAPEGDVVTPTPTPTTTPAATRTMPTPTTAADVTTVMVGTPAEVLAAEEARRVSQLARSLAALAAHRGWDAAALDAAIRRLASARTREEDRARRGRLVRALRQELGLMSAAGRSSAHEATRVPAVTIGAARPGRA